tara:strand:+ start:3360 stop:3611 length:252 start_codon:yes stop_codon:yes gene_type:complete
VESSIGLEVRAILATVLRLEEAIISSDASTDNLDQWDSLAHMNLIVAIENKYNITFDEQEILESTNLISAIQLVKSKTTTSVT